MKLEVREDSKNYTCSVVKIGTIFDIEGADRVKRTVIQGNEIVVSNTVKEGDLMLYFVSGTQLNAEYCKTNNLFDKSEENEDKEVRGFISFKQRRIKALKLRGIVSNGMLMPLNSLNRFCDASKLKMGDEFTTIEGTEICQKYIVKPQTASSGTGEKKQPKVKLKNLLLENQFKFHTDTAHFAKNIHKFDDESEVIITRKLHGSSMILSNVLVSKKLNLKERVAKFFGLPVVDSEYGIIWSSGKPKSQLPKGITSPSNKWTTGNKSFYTADIWQRAYQEIGHSLEKGITLYGEIIGEGIQGANYTYNQEYGIYIYRITTTSVEGHTTEFSWEQLKNYCTKYGLNYVQEYFSGKVKDLYSDDLLESLKAKYLNKSFPDCKIDEGICIRLRKDDEIYKLKSPNFILMESNAQEQEIVEFES